MLMTSISCINNTHLSINISALHWVSERQKEKDNKQADLRSLLNSQSSPLTFHYFCHRHPRRFMCPSSPVTGFIKDGISGLMGGTARSIHSHTRAAFGKDKKEFICKLFVLVFCAPFTPPSLIFPPNINAVYGKQPFPFSLINISSEGRGGGRWKGIKKEPPSTLGKTWE